MQIRETPMDRLSVALRKRARTNGLVSKGIEHPTVRLLAFLASSVYGSVTDNPAKARVLLAVRRNTGMSYDLLSRLYDLTEEVNCQALDGSLVQCGVWKGGGAAVIVSASLGLARDIWLFDSWQGLPPPSPDDKVIAGKAASQGMYSASIDDVKQLLSRLGKLPSPRLHLEKGLFQATIPRALGMIGPIALLDLDCDLFDSTATCLRLLFPQVVRGGYVIVEDYNYWAGSKRATDEFVTGAGRNIRKLLETSLSLYLQKLE